MSQQQMSPEMAKELQAWQSEVNSLCHEVFFQTDAGKRLLSLWEQRWFYAPVADPSISMDYARFREGRNDHIRSIRACAYAAMRPKESTQLNKELEHEIENV